MSPGRFAEPPIRYIAAASGVGVALSLVWLSPGLMMDFAFDWLSTRAFVIGTDPFAPIADLIVATGVDAQLASRWQDVEILHPRTPGAILLLSPVALVPWDTVYELGRILVVLSTAALVWLCARAARIDPAQVLMFLPLVMVVWPFAGTLRTANTGILVAALVAATWFSRERFLAGIPLGIAVTLKLWPWLLIPSLFISGRRKSAISAAVTFLTLNCVGLAFSNVTLAASLEGMRQAAEVHGPRSLALLPVWGSVLASSVFLGLMIRLKWSASWAIPGAIVLAPMVWSTYLPVLLVPVAKLVGERRTRTGNAPGLVLSLLTRSGFGR